MRLRRLYSNLDHYFTPIEFNEGLNIVLAEVRLPENRSKSTHNLGKSTLARIIDFCLLGSVGKDHFFRKREDLFSEFVFFLEMEMLDGSFLTVRRGVSNYSKISFAHSAASQTDLSSMQEAEWSHFELPFDKAKSLLDGYLDLRDLDPWTFRNAIGYFLRTQADYDDVFRLQRHAGQDKDWKPILAKILGLDASIFAKRYELRSEIEVKAALLIKAQRDLDGQNSDPEKVESLIQLREADVSRMQSELDSFDFSQFDAEQTRRIVDSLDVDISSLNQRRYTLSHSVSELERASRADSISLEPEKVKALFDEAGALFPDQVKVDFEQLISFNKSISEERRQYISEELAATKVELASINAKLNELNAARKSRLSYLRSEDVFDKYRAVSSELARTNAEVQLLRQHYEVLTSIQDRRTDLQLEKAKLAELQGAAVLELRKSSQDRSSLFSTVRTYFSEQIKSILGRDAILAVTLNGEGNLEFRTEFIDGNELATSEADGTSFKKLLCVAFDLAVVRAHLTGSFPRFVFHDGVLELLDPRPKSNLLESIRAYAAAGVQSIITVMDFDLPSLSDGSLADDFEQGVILRLHDDGPQGRLFHFEGW